MTPEHYTGRITRFSSRWGTLALALVCASCQPASICFVARDETSDSIATLKVERRTLVPGATQPQAWQTIDPAQISWDDAVVIQPLQGDDADELRFSAPGYGQRSFQVQWHPLSVREGSTEARGYGDGNRLFDATMRLISSDFPTRPVRRMSQDWAAVLAKVVTPGGYVRWDLLQNNTGGVRDRLASYVDQLAEFSPDNRPDLFPNVQCLSNHAERIAYWINAYNALSMYWVIQHGYPATIPSARAGRFVVGTKSMSVDDIEGLLRRENACGYVFAINCCARSCPPLRAQPYDGTHLLEQLGDQSHTYLRDPRAVVRDGDTIKLNDCIFLHRAELGAMVQSQGQNGMNSEAYLTGAAMTELRVMARQPAGPFDGYKQIGKLGFDWTLNRPPTD